MSVTDEVLRANEAYARNFNLGSLAKPPARKLAVLACMDARLSVEQFLGLKTGDAHIIRNAGGIVTEDALRSLLISHHLLGTQEFVIINHTDCGMLTFSDDELRSRLERSTGRSAVVPAYFHSFRDVEENLRRQIERLRSHAWIPSQVAVRGFVYEVESGRLREAAAEQARRAG
ncbi:MAG TPA: carbonic anhydrase [Terriglobales bacterium]|jgi:carbonic anhydrase|nr:carbonic anhydrase [Terriglobales bacterium]